MIIITNSQFNSMSLIIEAIADALGSVEFCSARVILASKSLRLKVRMSGFADGAGAGGAAGAGTGGQVGGGWVPTAVARAFAFTKG